MFPGTSITTVSASDSINFCSIARQTNFKMDKNEWETP